MNKLWRGLQALGPGLIFAGAAIGVSHLVQSTRAGADFGFGLIWALLLANIMKYPSFQFAPRYALATGESLIDGYKRLGKWVLVFYFLLTFFTMFTIQAAVTVITGGLAQQLFGITLELGWWCALITLICFSILMLGKYQILDKLMKFIVLLLAITTISAVVIAFMDNEKEFSLLPIWPSGEIQIAFLIAFMGWMPAPMDVATWHSLWAIEKAKGQKDFTPKKAMFDFNIGYLATIVLGIFFVCLGALVMFDSGKTLSSGAGQFAGQLIQMYTDNLGKGAAIFVAVAAFTTMFSTTLTTLDASPRAMEKTVNLLSGRVRKGAYLFWMILLSLGTISILFWFKTSMITFVKIATILSFLTAPLYALANLLLVSGKHMPEKDRPGKALIAFSWLGILFLVLFSIWYAMTVL